MTFDQEQKIRQAFREAGLPDYVGMELTAVIPHLVTLVKQQETGEPFRGLSFHLRLGDETYWLRFEED